MADAPITPIATFTYLGQSVTLDPSKFGEFVEQRKVLNLMLVRLDMEARERAKANSNACAPAEMHVGRQSA